MYQKLLSCVLMAYLALHSLHAENATAAPIDLCVYEKKVTSQNGEDGVIEAIFSFIGTESKYFVEFGAENGNECNTRFLRSYHDWKGLLMDGSNDNPAINLHREFITAENINLLFKKYEVPANLDLLSIDIDYNDFYVWKAIDASYRPRLVVIEYNASHLPDQDKIVIYDPQSGWDGVSRYFGASISALYQIGRKKGYSLVYAENRGVNLFFIRDDILATLSHQGIYFKDVNDVNLLYKPPNYIVGGDHPTKKSYASAADLLN